jgi:ferrous iron transport protein B
MFSRAVSRTSPSARCSECGYDISNLPHATRCPECNADLDIAETRSDRIDRVLLNPLLGLGIFAAVMTGLFYSLFVLAQYPMGWIEGIFSWGGKLIESNMGAGVLRDLLANGVVGGVGATVVFLPQILLLFFLISLLEDTGYLARGAFLMDRLLRPFGLPGHAFVPLLSSHACALPGIMATRGIPDPKERLATILVAPFMTCSARLPVYVLLTTLLFAGRPLMAALAFVGCYVLGIVAGVLSALIARRTILRGKSRPMAMELPCYKWPSLRTATLTTLDRGKVFLKSAGTNILMICIVLWWLGSYPKVEAPAEATKIRANAELLARVTADKETYADFPPRELTPERLAQIATEIRAKADSIEARHQAQHSYLGRIGSFLQPVFAPLGYDRQLTIGVLASFAAREVFVSTMSIVVAGQEEEDDTLFETLSTAKRDDGVTPIFTRATSWSLLVYYVLAMQCLPTLAVTAREAGGRKWALLQLVWMCGMAYVLAMIVYQVMK